MSLSMLPRTNVLRETLKSGLLAVQFCRDNVILKVPEADSKIDANLLLKVALRNHWLYDCNTQGLNEARLLKWKPSSPCLVCFENSSGKIWHLSPIKKKTKLNICYLPSQKSSTKIRFRKSLIASSQQWWKTCCKGLRKRLKLIQKSAGLSSVFLLKPKLK